MKAYTLRQTCWIKVRWHFGGILDVTYEKVLAQNMGQFIKGLWFTQVKMRGQAILPSGEWDGYFLSLLLHPGHSKVIGMWKCLESEISIGDSIWGRRTVAIGLYFWNYFGLSAFVGLLVFDFYYFPCLNAFLLRVPFESGKLREDKKAGYVVVVLSSRVRWEISDLLVCLSWLRKGDSDLE